jgi:hypothetical protein
MQDIKYKKYKYLGLITCLYVTMQLVSDVTAGKIINFHRRFCRRDP